MKAEARSNFQMKSRLPVGWLIGFVVWTLLALLTASRNHLTYLQLGADVPLKTILLSSFVDYYLWALVSIVIFRLTAKFPLEKPHLFRNAGIYLFLSAVLTLLVALVSIPVFYLLSGAENRIFPNLSDISGSIVFRPSNLYQGFITFWATLAVAHAVLFYRRAREKELRLQTFAAQIAEARLSALKMQIHPHFLFNTLNSISALLRRDADRAEQMIAYLGDFLRLTLAGSGDNQTSLKDELFFLETYLKIEKIRFRDRLTVKFDIAPETLSAFVPTLIMQPLVENAIKHGFSDRSENCLLEISAAKIAGKLQLTIKDNGAGFPASEQIVQNGVGLTNTTLRLKEIYRDDFAFDIINGNGAGGAIVRIETPFVVKENALNFNGS